MALVVPYESREGIKNAGYAGPVARQRSADEFLSLNDKMLAPALRDLSQGMGQLGQAIHEDNIRKREEAMQLELLNDIQGFQADSQKYFDDYSQANQGQNAAFAEQAGLEYYQKRLKTIQDKWAGNQRAQLYIARHGGELALSGINSMRDYGNREMERWKDSTMLGDQAEFQRLASDWNVSPEQVAASGRQFVARQYAYYRSKGLDHRAAAMEAERLYRNGVRANIMGRVGQSIQSNPAEFRRVMTGTPRSAALPSGVAELAGRAANKYGVDSALVNAIIAQESGGQAGAVSRAGARGLMQLMPGTAKDLGVNPDDPEQNVDGGVRYFKDLLSRYKGNRQHALWAYNWGMGNVDSFLKTGKGKNGQAMPAETRNYAHNILADYNMQKGGGRPVATGGLIQPVQGFSNISSGYGNRNTGIAGASTFHEAVDIPAPIGTPVMATIGGTIRTAANKGKNGNYIVIDGDDGRQHYFLHLNNFAAGLKPGDRVEQGLEIGAVGNTSTLKIGAHLDYRIKENGKFLDPAPFLNGEGQAAAAAADDQPVMMADNTLGQSVDVVSDAFGVAPSNNNVDAAEEQPGSVAGDDQFVDDGDWIFGDDAAMINEFLSPDDKRKLWLAYDKAEEGRIKAQRQEANERMGQADLNGNLTLEMIMSDPSLSRDEKLGWLKVADGEAGFQGYVKTAQKEAMEDTLYVARQTGAINSKDDLDHFYATQGAWNIFGRNDYERHLKEVEEGDKSLTGIINQFLTMNPDSFSGKDIKVKADQELFRVSAMKLIRQRRLTARNDSDQIQDLLADWLKDDTYKKADGFEKVSADYADKPGVMEKLIQERIDLGGHVKTEINQGRARESIVKNIPMREVMAPDADSWAGQGLMTLFDADSAFPTTWLANKVADFFTKSSSIRVHKALFEDAGNSYNVDPNLLAALAYVASGGDRFAASALKPGAVGLMQLNPDTGRQLGAEDLTDPRSSIFAAANAMDQLLTFYQGNTKAALAAYAGVLDEKETTAFINEVLRVYNKNYGQAEIVAPGISQKRYVRPGDRK